MTRAKDAAEPSTLDLLRSWAREMESATSVVGADWDREPDPFAPLTFLPAPGTEEEAAWEDDPDRDEDDATPTEPPPDWGFSTPKPGRVLIGARVAEDQRRERSRHDTAQGGRGKQVLEDRRGRHWTPEEDALLTELWGEFGLEVVARRMKRSVWAVDSRAQRLKLGSLSGRTVVLMAHACQKLGYTVETVRNAADHLGIKLANVHAADPDHLKNRRLPARRGLLEEDVDRLAAFFRAHPGRLYTVRPELKKTPKTAWGTGNKPPACLGHGGTDRPHHSGGRCVYCYNYRLRTGADPQRKPSAP